MARSNGAHKKKTGKAAGQAQATIQPESCEGEARINCRVTPLLKSRIEAAARLKGQTLTSFTELALAEKADAVLAEHERISLSEGAFRAFLEALEAPPEAPSPKLLKAVAAYRARRSG